MKLRRAAPAESAPPAPDFGQAQEAYQAARAELAKASKEVEAARAASAVGDLESKEFDRNPEHRARGQDFLQRHFQGKSAKPARLAELIEDLEEKESSAVERRDEAKDVLERARLAELSRMTDALKPRHREIIRRIGDALDALNAALDDETALHTELARSGLVGPGMTWLLDSARELFGSRLKLTAAVMEWSRAAHKRGIA